MISEGTGFFQRMRRNSFFCRKREPGCMPGPLEHLLIVSENHYLIFIVFLKPVEALKSFLYFLSCFFGTLIVAFF